MRRSLSSLLLSFLLLVFLPVVPSRLVADDFADDFERDDGPVDIDFDDDWLTTMGVADIRDGELVLESFGTEVWTWIDGEDFLFESDISISFQTHFDPPDSTPDVGRHGGLMFFATEKTDRYSPTMSGYTIDWIDRAADHGFRFHKWVNGAEQVLVPDLFAAQLADPPEEWQIVVAGPTITLVADGEEIISIEDESFRSGYVGFWGWSNGQHIHLDDVFVGAACDAVVSASAVSGPAPLDVEFDASGSTTPEGTITDFEWSFGDGESATGAQVAHRYERPGRYRARVKAITDDGRFCVASETITVLWTGDVDPYTAADVGDPVTPGGARFEGDCLSIFGGGRQIALREDSFHFVYREVGGDNVLTFQLSEVLGWQTGARVGAMFRESTDPDSVFAMMAVQNFDTSARAVFVNRSNAGGSTSTRLTASVGGIVALTPPESWLRIERQGAEFIGSTSTDGVTFTEFRRTTLDAPPETMLAGFALVAADVDLSGASAHVVVCPAATTPEEICTGGDDEDGDGKVDCDDEDCAGDTVACPPTPLFRRADSNADGRANIADAQFLLNHLFLGGPAPPCSDASDANDDGRANIADAQFLLNHLFLGGPAPPAPWGDCGEDPSADDLDCAGPSGC